MDDLTMKLEEMRRIYRSKNHNGMLVEKQHNISWLLGGRYYVNLATTDGIADLLINDQDIFLLANNIEAKRMVKEELSKEIRIMQYNWYELGAREALADELSGGKYVKDSVCENEIRPLRVVMTENEKEAYYRLGRDTASVMQETCLLVKPEMSEFNAAGIMAKKCIDMEIEPIIILVAADERIMRYRHPLPTSNTIRDYLMLVLGGRRNGQIACITRFLAFSNPPEDICRKRDTVLNLEAMLLTETRPGINVGKIFGKLIDGYASEGYPEEWKLHHQGGITGYMSREVKATFNTDITVAAGQAYAWNPSITGFKAEDTFIVEKGENIILTDTEALPYKEIGYQGKKIKRPDILIRKIIY